MQLVEAMNDTNINVRVRACWSLANLCDSLVALRYGYYLVHDFSLMLMQRLPGYRRRSG